MKTKEEIKSLVFDNLNDALENGYDVSDWLASDVVIDLRCFAEDCEDIEADDLLQPVEDWLKEIKCSS